MEEAHQQLEQQNIPQEEEEEMEGEMDEEQMQ